MPYLAGPAPTVVTIHVPMTGTELEAAWDPGNTKTQGALNVPLTWEGDTPRYAWENDAKPGLSAQNVDSLVIIPTDGGSYVGDQFDIDPDRGFAYVEGA